MFQCTSGGLRVGSFSLCEVQHVPSSWTSKNHRFLQVLLHPALSTSLDSLNQELLVTNYTQYQLSQGILHEARRPLTYSPVLQVVVNTALAISIEQSQEGVRRVIKEAGDGFPSAARGNLKHGNVSRGIAGKHSQVKHNSPGAGYQGPRRNKPPYERILLLCIAPFLQRSCLCFACVTDNYGTQPCSRSFLSTTLWEVLLSPFHMSAFSWV